MDSLLKYVSPSSVNQRLLSPKQFDVLVSSESQMLQRLPVLTLNTKVMYSSLYITYMSLVSTCESSSYWTKSTNVDFIHKADKFISELERCIHMGVINSKVMRDAILLMVGVGLTNHHEDHETQDWDLIMGSKFMDWVAYRASCVGNEIIGMTDDMYYALNEKRTGDLIVTTREMIMIPLSDMSNSPTFVNDLHLARTCYSISSRVRSIFRGESTHMRDVARALEAVVGEWVVGQL